MPGAAELLLLFDCCCCGGCDGDGDLDNGSSTACWALFSSWDIVGESGVWGRLYSSEDGELLNEGVDGIAIGRVMGNGYAISQRTPGGITRGHASGAQAYISAKGFWLGGGGIGSRQGSRELEAGSISGE